MFFLDTFTGPSKLPQTRLQRRNGTIFLLPHRASRATIVSAFRHTQKYPTDATLIGEPDRPGTPRVVAQLWRERNPRLARAGSRPASRAAILRARYSMVLEVPSFSSTFTFVASNFIPLLECFRSWHPTSSRALLVWNPAPAAASTATSSSVSYSARVVDTSASGFVKRPCGLLLIAAAAKTASLVQGVFSLADSTGKQYKESDSY